MSANEKMREALEAIETVLEDAYHRHFAECCGRGYGDCCGDFVEQWTPEDHKILNTLSPIQRSLQEALAEPAEPAAQETTPEAVRKPPRLTDEELNEIAKQSFEKFCGRPHQFEGVQDWVIHAMRKVDNRAPIDAMEAKASAINEQMLKVLKRLKITGPDDDGLLWLVLDEKYSTRRAGFNLGDASNISGQVALKMKDDIFAAIAAAEAHKGQKC